MISTLAIVLLACGGDPPPAAPPAPPPVVEAPPVPEVPTQVVRALELAKIVEASPADADAALAAKGSSRAELDALLYEIAVDPALSAAYAAGRGR